MASRPRRERSKRPRWSRGRQHAEEHPGSPAASHQSSSNRGSDGDGSWHGYHLSASDAGPEGVVTGAADGYGRMLDRPAATLLHLGPGLGNGLSNLHNAKKARTPIVNIIGEHIDYCGYSVLPAALEQDFVMAYVISDDDKITSP